VSTVLELTVWRLLPKRSVEDELDLAPPPRMMGKAVEGLEALWDRWWRYLFRILGMNERKGILAEEEQRYQMDGRGGETVRNRKEDVGWTESR